MAAAEYNYSGGDPTSAPRRTLVVTPADSELEYLTRTIRSSAAGVIKVTNADGTTCLANFAAGETRVMCVRQIWSTGTTVVGVIEASY